MNISETQLKGLEALVSSRLGGVRVTLRENNVQGVGGMAFRGVLADGRAIFVKLGPADSIARSFAVLKACRGLSFVPELLIDDLPTTGGWTVLCTTCVDGRHIRDFETMSEAQVESLVRGYAAFSERIQGLAEQAQPVSLAGSPSMAMDRLREYARRHVLARWLLKDLLSLDLAALRKGRQLRVIHNDLNVTNYAFDGDRLSALYDYDLLARGLTCEDLVLVPAIRSREAAQSAANRRRIKSLFKRMVRVAPWPTDEWRAALQEQRIRWADFLLAHKPKALALSFKLRRRDRRMDLLFSALDEIDRGEGE